MKTAALMFCLMAAYAVAQASAFSNVNPELGPATPTSSEQAVMRRWDVLLDPKQPVMKPRREAKAGTTNDLFDAKSVRMISQVVTPANEAEAVNQMRELTWFRARGFNAALLVWKGEPPEQLAEIARVLRNDGWLLAWTFGPEEGYGSLGRQYLRVVEQSNVYVDPEEYRTAAKKLSPHCAFVVPTWRRATVHHFMTVTGPLTMSGGEAGERYLATLTEIIREVAPELPIVGVWSLPLTSKNAKETTCPDWSGTVVLEGAWKGYQLPRITKRMEQWRIPKPYIFLLSGPQPYWDSTMMTREADLLYDGKPNDPPKDLKAKMQMVLSYNEATMMELSRLGCGAIVTGMGGGGTRRLGNEVSDDLTRTEWSKSE